VHGWHDDIIPPESALRFARSHQAELHLLHDSHRLIDSLPIIEQVFDRFLVRLLREPRSKPRSTD